MEISRYKREHEDVVMAALKKDPNWDMFTKAEAIDSYKKRLLESVTYVCLENGVFCGYVRALLDECFAAYISELFVVSEWRNKTVGRALVEKLNNHRLKPVGSSYGLKVRIRVG